MTEDDYDFMSDPTILRYYDEWVKVPTLFAGNPFDERRFYRFVKACMKYAEARNLMPIEALNTNSVKKKLIESMHAQMEIDDLVYLKHIERFILRFSDFMWYESESTDLD